MRIDQQNSSYQMKSSIFNPSPYGASEEAIILDDERYRENGPPLRTDDTAFSVSSIIQEIKQIASECSEKNWDGYDAAPIDMDSVNAAIHFLHGIQISQPIPDVVPEPDGDLALEWEIDADNWLIVSFHGTSFIHFAAKFGEGTRFEGKEPNDNQHKKFILGFLDRIIEKYNNIMN